MNEYFECDNIECMAYFEGHCLWKKSDKDKIDISDSKTCPKIIEQLRREMSKLEIAKKIIKENLFKAKYGLFDSRNMAGDIMTTLYDEDGLTIEICYGWSYFEVFGLSDDEFEELADFYRQLKEE